jgi:hypothetical protein
MKLETGKVKLETGNWNVIALMLVLFGLFSGLPCQAADAVEPVTLAVTNKRLESASAITYGGTIYKNSSLVFTNCQLYADSTGVTKQGLDGVTVEVAVGSLTTNITYTATTQGSAANGMWGCTVAVPNLSAFMIQVKVTDSSTNSYIYSSKTVSTETSMFD